MRTSIMLSFLVLVSCLHHLQPPAIDIIEVEATTTGDRLSNHEKLTSYLSQNPDLAEIVADAKLLSEAEEFIADGKPAQALLVLADAFEVAEGVFKSHILRKYLSLLADTQPHPQPLAFYATHVRYYLKHHGKRVDRTIAKHLGKLLADKEGEEAGLPTDLWTLMQDDPTLETHAQRYCQQPEADPEWENLIASFPVQLQTYWQGLIASCRGEAEKALTLHYRYLDYATESTIYPQLALTTASGIIALGRKMGKNRAWLADSYDQLARIWQRGEDFIDHTSLKTTPVGLIAKKIRDLLWAARYHTLMGAYEQAIVLARQSLAEARQVLAQGMTKRRKFLRLIAEAYHILAFRVEVERRDYHQAIAYSEEALLLDLSDDWRERFLWYRGLYHFLLEDWQRAIASWEESMRLFPDSNIRPRLLYWIAEASHKQEPAPHPYLQELEQKFPLSYYAVVATSSQPPWYRRLSPSTLHQAIVANAGLDLRKYHQHKKFARALLRAEIFIGAQLFSLAQIELRAVEYRLPYVSHRIVGGLRLYLSRLYFASHRYARSMDIITQSLATQDSYWHEHPEQMLIYFPQPYADLYRRAAERADVPTALLLAISRQESAFRSDARSRANALGVMQILPTTATKIATQHRLPREQIEHQLLQPERNIHLGALHLQELMSHYRQDLSAIFASYNAGREAVDAWLTRRYHPDPHLWIELIPFGETKNYVKKVLRNYAIYRFLQAPPPQLAEGY